MTTERESAEVRLSQLVTDRGNEVDRRALDSLTTRLAELEGAKQEAEYARVVADEAIRQKDAALARLSRLEEALERARPVVKYAANMPDSDNMPEWAKELRHRARTALDSETKGEP